MAKEEFGNLASSNDAALDKARIQSWFDTNCAGESECGARFKMDGSGNSDPKTSTTGWLK